MMNLDESLASPLPCPGAVLGGGATEASAPVTLSLDPPVAPPDRESASIIQ